MPSHNTKSSKKPAGSNWRTCKSCGVRLWKWIDDNRIKLLGSSGQDYEIGFTYIRVTCSKCGQGNTAESDLVEQIGEAYFEMSRTTIQCMLAQKERNPYFTLSNYDRRRVLKNLNEIEREILQHLTEVGKESGNLFASVAQAFEIDIETVKNYIERIDLEVSKIKPDFRGRSINIQTKDL